MNSRYCRCLTFFRPSLATRTLAPLVGLSVALFLWGHYPQPRFSTRVSSFWINAHYVPSYSIHFTPDSRLLATIPRSTLLLMHTTRTLERRDDDTVCLWDLATGQVACRIEEKLSSTVAFTSDGRTMAAAFRDKETIGVWDLGTGRRRTTFHRKEWSESIRLVYSPHEELLLLDRHFDLWNVTEGKVVAALAPVPGQNHGPVIHPWIPPMAWYP